MSRRKIPQETITDTPAVAVGRRRFLGTAAAAGLAGTGLCGGLSGCKEREPEVGAAKPTAAVTGTGTATAVAHSHEVPPGQLDEYYGFWSGGHSGEFRILAVPSMREIKRIPVFQMDAVSGWGMTNESRKILGMKPDGSLRYTTGDSHHPVASYADGTYDGKYAWTNDKLNTRIARIRLDTFECDKITELPNVQGLHGACPDKRDPLDPKINHTTRLFVGSEFGIPIPNDGRDMDKRESYVSLVTCIDSETMEVRWQCQVDGNMDLLATSYDGKLAAWNQYNSENGLVFADMMSAERDNVVFVNIARVEQAIKNGKFKTSGTSKVPIADGTKAANADPKTALVCYVPVPKNPHGVNASPDGKYFICSGKLSPTCSVIDLALMLKWFDGELKEPRQTVVAEPEIGLGPLHTTYDGRGNAYTTLFLDSQVVKWNIDAAIKAFQGDKNAKVVIDRIDCHYQPGHLNASMAETREADGKWLVVGSKFSKDRYLPVGPLHDENEQLFDIGSEKMKLLGDHPAHPEPHDFIIVKRDKIKTRQVYKLEDFPVAVRDFSKDSRIERKGKRVTVFLAAAAPQFSMPEIRVKRGDEITVILTNIDNVEDLTHGFAIQNYNVNFIVNPGETKSVTFKADKPGVYWCYCSHFCHALHLEMRSRMLVEV
jgi:nitrous-oxide reductase